MGDMRSISSIILSSVQSLGCTWLFVTPWTTACQTFQSITNSGSLLKLMPIESVMPSSHLILFCPLLLPPIPPSIRVFSNESTLRMRWPKYWSFSFSIIPSKKSQGWSPSEWTGWVSLQSKELSRIFSNTTRDLFKKVRDTKGTFYAKVGLIKDRNCMDLTEAEDIN